MFCHKQQIAWTLTPPVEARMKAGCHVYLIEKKNIYAGCRAATND